MENYNNGINLLNYKKIVHNFQNKNLNNIRNISVDSNQNLSNNNNSSTLISPIDHLFYRQITNISSLNKTNNHFISKKTSNLSPINNIHAYANIIKNNKNLNKLNVSFPNVKNKGKEKNYLFHDKTNKNSFIQKNHSTLNIGKEKNKKYIDLDSNKNLENNYKKKINKNFFQPKNIFSKFKPKKNKILIHEELLLNQKLLVTINNVEKQKKNNDNIINGFKFEGNNNSKSNINKKDNDEKEEKLDVYNNKNNCSNNNNLFIKNIQNNENTQLNSYNILSNTTLITGIDNYNNNTSQNITENINHYNNNNSRIIFKGKKIRCIHDISKTGLSGEEKKVNQDRYFIFRNFVTGYENIFMGVLDGHGYYGHEVSEYIRENLPMDLNRVLKTKKLNLLKDDLSQAIKQTFEMENNSLLRNKQIDSNLSGSTCVSIIYTPEKLIIANLGDSRCVLGKKINNEWKAENLTKDHKPSVPEEAERIKSFGGRIRPMKDEDGNFIGPLRVYMKEKDIPGLAMTRSFGDYYASTAGTISIPEVSEYKFIPEDKFLILASDGLFEFIDSDEAVSIVSGYYEKNDIVGCSEFLYKESYRKWIYEEEDTVDDITIILVFFED